MILHYNIKISGKVQKIGYRYQVYINASRFGLTGFVRNESDQSVYIEAEGQEENLNDFLDWCRQGTEHAIIENIDMKRAPVENYREFTISRS